MPPHLVWIFELSLFPQSFYRKTLNPIAELRLERRREMKGLSRSAAAAAIISVTEFHQQSTFLLRLRGAFSISTRVVLSTLLIEEKEQVQRVLTMFLKRHALSTAAAATRTLRREFTTINIKEDAHNPYLGNLCKEHGESLVAIMENLPNLPANEHKKQEETSHILKSEQERSISQASPTNLPRHSRKLKAMARMAEIGTNGQLPPNTLYFMDIGLNMDQIKVMARKYPSITCPGLERKVRPLVEFFLDLGMLPSDICNILYKLPQLCDLSLSENIIPSMDYIETFGLDKSQWVKLIKKFPNLLACSKQKVKATVDYLYELGLPSNRIAKCIDRCPQIIGFSVDYNLRPKAEYFHSMGVNLTFLLNTSPQVFSRSIESKLKPVTEFLLDKGYSIDEIGTMASRFGTMYCCSLTKSLIPKWDFFLTMDCPRSEMVKYPQYFGHSLEKRIKPRYAQMRECAMKLTLSQLLRPSDSEFEKLLNRSMNKVLDAHLPSSIP